jgi:hypothetical protein
LGLIPIVESWDSIPLNRIGARRRAYVYGKSYKQPIFETDLPNLESQTSENIHTSGLGKS